MYKITVTIRDWNVNNLPFLHLSSSREHSEQQRHEEEPMLRLL